MKSQNKNLKNFPILEDREEIIASFIKIHSDHFLCLKTTLIAFRNRHAIIVKRKHDKSLFNT